MFLIFSWKAIKPQASPNRNKRRKINLARLEKKLNPYRTNYNELKIIVLQVLVK